MNQLPDEVIELALNSQEHLDAISYSEKLNQIPFDLTETFTINPICFGYMGTGDNINAWAKIKNTSKLEYNGKVGQIVGDRFDRVIVYLSDGYFGWLNPDQWERVFLAGIPTEDTFIVRFQ